MNMIKVGDVIVTSGKQSIKVAELLEAKDGYEVRFLGHLWVNSKKNWTKKTSLWELHKLELVN